MHAATWVVPARRHQAILTALPRQAGGDNKALDVKVPIGITRLFKSNLDWNLYTDQQEPLEERKVGHLALGMLQAIL